MRSLIVVLSALVAASFAVDPQDREPAREPAKIEALAWLAGSWVGVEGKTETEEVWMAPKGGAMIGMHRDVTGNKMTGFEFLRIQAQGDKISYLASPGGRSPTVFPMIECGDKKVVFENPAHDFPKRILYWLDQDDALHARIEGDADSKQRPMEWRWRRPEAGAPK